MWDEGPGKGAIRRGPEGLSPTAESAVDPGTMTLRKVLAWLTLIVILAALTGYALLSGVL